MAVPYMKKTLNGWVKNTNVVIITKSIVDYEEVETETATTLKINKQPVPQTKVDRKPESQREWKWWSFIIQGETLLKVDDIIIVDSIRYRIENISNWSESGFTKYEAIEDYA